MLTNEEDDHNTGKMTGYNIRIVKIFLNIIYVCSTYLHAKMFHMTIFLKTERMI
jgi:hypothetical protein